MPSSRIAGNSFDSHSEPLNRQVGALGVAEQWWRDRYDEIAEHGYRLRPRYQPNWQPSWLKSGKNFYSVEDGQPIKVHVSAIIYIYPSTYVGNSQGQQWTRPACEIAFKSC